MRRRQTLAGVLVAALILAIVPGVATADGPKDADEWRAVLLERLVKQTVQRGDNGPWFLGFGTCTTTDGGYIGFSAIGPAGIRGWSNNVKIKVSDCVPKTINWHSWEKIEN
jgi:hypothetical protein